LNQTEDVTVYRLTIANSVEERILELQEKKRQLATAAIEGGKAVGKLNMQDILQLFRRDAEHGSHHEDIGSAVVGSGRGVGLLDRPLEKAKPAAAINEAPSQQVGDRMKQREKQKFKIPPSLQPQYDATFGRRW
jgi:hypothetical protein